MSKEQWKNIIYTAINETDTTEIMEICQKSSKCKNLTNTAENREYIENIDSKSAKIILLEKLKMTDVKTNYKGSYTTYNCRLCGKEEENTTHLLNCKELGEIDSNMIGIHKKLTENKSAMLPDDLKSLAKHILLKISKRDKLVSDTASGTSIDEDNH